MTLLLRLISWRDGITTDDGIAYLTLHTLDGMEVYLKVRSGNEFIMNIGTHMTECEVSSVLRNLKPSPLAWKCHGNTPDGPGKYISLWMMNNSNVKHISQYEQLSSMECTPDMLDCVTSRRDIDIVECPKLTLMNVSPIAILKRWCEIDIGGWLELRDSQSDTECHAVNLRGFPNSHHSVSRQHCTKTVMWRSSSTRDNNVVMIVAMLIMTMDVMKSSDSLHCMVWYTGNINVARITTVSHGLNLVKCENGVILTERFLTWLVTVKPHYIVSHGDDIDEIKKNHGYGKRENTHDFLNYPVRIDLHRYSLRWYPMFNSHDLQSLGLYLLNREIVGYSKVQCHSAHEDDDVKTRSQIISYMIGEVHLLIRLWVNLEPKMIEQSTIMRCGLENLTRYSDSEMIKHLGYVMNMSLHGHCDTYKSELRQLTVLKNVRHYDYGHCLELYCRWKLGEHCTWKSLQLLSLQDSNGDMILPCHIYAKMIREIHPEIYMDWVRFMEMNGFILSQYCAYQGEDENINTNVTISDLRLREINRWEMMIILTPNSYIALVRPGMVIRMGHHEICKPESHKSRRLCDDILVSISRGIEPRISPDLSNITDNT